VLNMRLLTEQDLGLIMSDWGVSITLYSPDGVEDQVRGLVFSDSSEFNPDTGQAVIAFRPHVVLRKSTMVRVPKAGESWIVKAPISPGGDDEDFMLDPTYPPEGGDSAGYIKLFLRRAEQSS
jgi:hypothetical protein